MLLRNFATALAALTALSLGASACVNDDKLPVIPPLPEASVPTPPAPTSTTPLDAEPPPPDAAVPPLDAGLDGSAFASGLGAGAVVTKSAKYTLITKTGGSPGGHGVGKTPAHTIVSGAASGSKK